MSVTGGTGARVGDACLGRVAVARTSSSSLWLLLRRKKKVNIPENASCSSALMKQATRHFAPVTGTRRSATTALPYLLTATTQHILSTAPPHTSRSASECVSRPLQLIC